MAEAKAEKAPRPPKGTAAALANAPPLSGSVPESPQSPIPPTPDTPIAPPPPTPRVTETQLLEKYKKLEAAMAVATDGAEMLTLFMQRYADDPVGFVKQVLKANPLPWQEEFLQAIQRGERRISIRAGHGVGKSTACSWALIWHMVTRYPQKAVCTAPTAGQLYDALFSEVKRWVNALPDFLKNMFEVFSERIVLKAAPESSFISARTSSAERPEALAGIHSEHVLMIVDEASAVPETIYEAAAGSMSGHSATTVLIGNPTRNSGLFYKTHHALKKIASTPEGEGWLTMHVSCAHPSVARLVSTDFIKQIAATYGEESNAYRVRVLGEFALRDDDVLIPAELVDAAMSRDIMPSPLEPLVYGLDVARFGNDRSVLCKRRGNVVLEFKTWQNLDLMQLVGAVINEATLDALPRDGTGANQRPIYGPTGGNPIDTGPREICIDSIGLGSGVADRLREVQGAIPALQQVAIRDVNVSEAAAMNPNANRLRDDLWLSCRDWLRARACVLPKDDDLRQELVSPTYKFTSTGKLQVEPKDSLKKRGLRSPDIADSLCLTFASNAALVGGRGTRWNTGQPLRRNIRGIV